MMGFVRTIIALLLGVSLAARASLASPPSCDGMLCTVSGRTRACSRFPNYVCCKGPEPGQWSMIYHSAESPDMKCCRGSGELYDPSRQLCVKGAIRNKMSHTEYECGSSSSYDARREKCCLKNATYGVVHPKVGTCCNETNLIKPELNCCEGQIYNVTEQTCCPSADGLHRRYDIPNGNCCGVVAYNPVTQKCTPDIGVIDKTADELSICESHDSRPMYFNNVTHMCCSGDIYSRANFLCYKARIAVPKTNDKDNSVCSKRHAHTRIATYHTFYNGPDSPKICIEGNVLHLREGQSGCPGSNNKLYNTRTDLCCGGMTFVENGRAMGLKCCEKGYKSYDPIEETCCLGEVHRLSEARGARCCLKKPYDPRTHRCLAESGRLRKAICPDPSRPLYPDRCNLTVEAIEDVRDILSNGGFYVYFGTVSGSSSRKNMRKWTLTDVKQLVSKKSKRKRKPEKSKMESIGSATLQARKCTCPFEMVPGERYIIFAEKPIRGNSRKRFQVRVRDERQRKGKDVIIPINDAEKLGLWFQRLFR